MGRLLVYFVSFGQRSHALRHRSGRVFSNGGVEGGCSGRS